MRHLSRWLLSRTLVHYSHNHTFQKTKSLSAKPNVENLEDRVVPARPLPLPVIYVGAEFGAPPTVKGFDAETGVLNFERTVYEAGFKGGVNVATADITRDKYPT